MSTHQFDQENQRKTEPAAATCPISATTVIERKGDMSSVILSDEGKIIGDVDEVRTGKIIKRVNGRRIALDRRCEKYQRKPQAEAYS